jgi:hypothetical protein
MRMSTKNTGQGNFPLENLTYDVITILYEKSKALEAYDKYLKDAQGDQQLVQVFQQIRQQDEQQIRLLQQHLGRLIGTQGNVKGVGVTNP